MEILAILFESDLEDEWDDEDDEEDVYESDRRADIRERIIYRIGVEISRLKRRRRYIKASELIEPHEAEWHKLLKKGSDAALLKTIGLTLASFLQLLKYFEVTF